MFPFFTKVTKQESNGEYPAVGRTVTEYYILGLNVATIVLEYGYASSDVKEAE